ncbi:hypothetical protein [Pseudothauera rhizosphaerae]|uniref:Uncharacterized protein n=1 Tax=Pseudothauera rhizosphaerae TaxID=2565932 RepID=A0A4S4A7F0_9RHOO|nr:hypothetical protein [Pseudothauera rhizosphaerae]THF54656.1 hypothetical protein E6O51_21570 [Pseudothauera rhizosphaerae]
MQQTTQYGPGDRITWGPISSHADPRYDAEIDADREDAIQITAAALLDQYLADPASISAAHWELTDAEYKAIDEAHAERDAMKLFKVRDAAVRRVLGRWAEEKARDDFAKMEREDAEDAMRARMGD